MLSVNNSLLPCALGAYVQCCHKATCRVQEKVFRKAKPIRSTPSGSNLKMQQKPSCDIEVQPSYIDKLVRAYAHVSPDYELKVDALTPRTLYYTSLLQANKVFSNQIRNFRMKAQNAKQDAKTSETAGDETFADHGKKMSKLLNLNARESMSFGIGMQEGWNMNMKSERSKSSKRERLNVILNAVMVVAIICVIYKIFRNTGMKGDMFSSALQNKDYQAEIPDTSFEDVKGIDEVKQELLEVVEFLRDPERFTHLGGKLPKGMLLSGPPGTGKTLLARAIAGEAGVPFFFASGSEFDEMFVGLGSSRVRGLFASARENAPCIIFIDEIDACGSTRTSSPLQPYARQTINQLLQEMDGFTSKDSVIVLGATNMPETLDRALTRPGRFDSEIKVLSPDVKGRKEILELYASRIVCGDDLDLERMACLTGGMTGAALSNLVNQAALRAAQLKKAYVEMKDFEYALDKLRLGPELRSRIPTEAELEVTAFHEAGHALVAFYTPDTMPIYKASIRQRGAALGHVAQMPTKEDETGSTKSKMLAQIDVLMGGRVAEEMFKGKDHVSTGASSDLQQATRIAYEFVCTMGMSDGLGFVRYEYENASADTKNKIEREVSKILEASYMRAKDLLHKHSHQHKLLAKGLIKFETLDLSEIKTLLSTQSLKSLEKMKVSQPSTSPSQPAVGDSDSIPSIL